MSQTIKKKDIDDKLVLCHFVNGETLKRITEGFLHEIMQHLLAGDEVHLPGFGTFRVSVRRGKRYKATTLKKGSFKKSESRGTTTVLVERKYYVNFRRAAAFREKFNARYGKNTTKDERK